MSGVEHSAATTGTSTPKRRLAVFLIAAGLLAGCANQSAVHAAPAAAKHVVKAHTAAKHKHVKPHHTAKAAHPAHSAHPLLVRPPAARKISSTGSRSAGAPSHSTPVPSRLSATPPVLPACGRSATPPAGYQHVIWIWLENRSYDSVIGGAGTAARRRAPYFNQLANSCGLAENYHNVSHPSQPNYFAAVAGTTGNVTTNCEPSTCSLPGIPTLFTQLTAERLQWRSYEENMAQPCTTGNMATYVDRHNPVVYFPADGEQCRAWDLPMGGHSSGALADALRTNTLPAFSFITPDVCTDMHSCPTRTGDDWLARWVPQIVASPAYKAGSTVVFLTFDEGEGGRSYDCATNTTDIGCHVATIVVSPSTRPGTRSTELFNHYSLLKTTEQLLHLPLLLGHAADPATASMATAFGLSRS
jgi:phosphatidylinositol-3-phosphatase